MKISPQFEKYCEIKNAFLAEGIDIDELLSRKPIKHSKGHYKIVISISLLILVSFGLMTYFATINANNNIAIVRVK